MSNIIPFPMPTEPCSWCGRDFIPNFKPKDGLDKFCSKGCADTCAREMYKIKMEEDSNEKN